MAKKNFGRFLTFAAIAGAAAAGISYFLQYKSFHKELDEDFHDFEDDLDEFEDTDDEKSTATRNYVPLTPDRKCGDTDTTAEDAADETGENDADTTAAEEEAGTGKSNADAAEEAAGKNNSDAAPASDGKDRDVSAQEDTTIVVEEMKE